MSPIQLLRPILAAELLLVAAAIPRPISAAPLRTQADNVPVCTAAGDQLAPRLAPDGVGGMIVVWQDQRDNDSDLYAQHILFSGIVDPAWPVNGVAVCTAPGAQGAARITSDRAHGAIVAWDDTRNGNYDIYAQHLLASGAVDPAWPPDGAAVHVGDGDQRNPALDSDSGAGAIIAWEDGIYQFGVPVNANVYAQHVTDGGIVDPDWPPEGVPIANTIENAHRPTVLMDRLGGAMVLFSAVPEGVRAHHLLVNGDFDPAWPPGGLSPFAPGYAVLRDDYAACPDGAGGAYIVVDADAPITAARLLGQHLASSGTLSGVLRLMTTNLPLHSALFSPAVGPDGLTGAAVSACESYYFEPGSCSPLSRCLTVYASYIPGPLGGVPWPARVAISASRDLGRWDGTSVVASDGAGGAIVAWEFTGADNRTQLYAKHILSTGEGDPWRPETGPVNGETSQIAPDMLSDGMGGATLVWEDSGTGAGSDIYSLRFFAPHPTPVLASLVSAAATSDAVRLVWSCTDRVALTASVQRTIDSNNWLRIGAVAAESYGRVQFVDRTVVAGARYGYRLEIPNGASATIAGETWLQVPAALALAFDGARPNPSTGLIEASFTLPVAQPATLELLDLAGRRIASREVGSLGVGSHVVDLMRGQPLAAGVYVLRLTQAGRSLSAKCVVLR